MWNYLRYGWGTGFGLIMGLVLLGVFIYTIISLRKQFLNQKNSREKRLRKRYERGEIDKKEYEARKKQLK